MDNPLALAATPEFALFVDLAMLGLAVAVVWILVAQRSALARLHDQLIRMDTREEDRANLAEQHDRILEERFRELDRSLTDGLAATREQLERRLGESLSRQIESGGQLRMELVERFEALQKAVGRELYEGRTQQGEAFANQQTRFEQRQAEALKTLQDTLYNNMRSTQQQVTEALARGADDVGKRVEALTRNTDERLKEISGQVDKRLTEGFEKTTETFADVLKRLALIDEAQKKITELSSNVVSLQEVLSDKRSRGAFGEIQLNSLVRNVLPESSFALQHTLSNSRIADCVLFLPPPTGNICIDAKFPLEAFRQMTDLERGELDRKAAERRFKADIRKHIQDIAERYIISGETADGAVMFIPAEAVFAEIQAHHEDLVQESHRRKVWMVSPTTLMAILNTARAVIKDEATRKQVHVIQEHLGHLAKDFERFQKRMDNLARHIGQVKSDVDDVHVSARRITSRFEKIESVELDQSEAPALEHVREPQPESQAEAESEPQAGD